LEEQDMSVQVRGSEGLPNELGDLQAFDIVLLSDVAATTFTSHQMELMRTYVQDLGGGLIMLGGQQSFGLGGYHATSLGDMLPVSSDFEKEQEKPSLAMVLIIDKSGSMGGSKLELAKDAARGTLELLGPRDQIGVVAFDGTSYWISELRSAEDKNVVSNRISTMEPAGGTNLYPAMVEAYNALASANAALKHAIILTDGVSAPGNFEGITDRMSADSITVSTVGMGTDADQRLLEMIARRGNGRNYFCDDPQSVPRIFAKETVTAGKSAIHEIPFIPRIVRPTQVLAEIDFDQAPFLLGFVATRPKPTSEFVLATETGEPLLAWWRYGLGVTVAFTSDAKSRWAAEWLPWPEFGRFWSQVVRHAMRKSEAKGVSVEVERRADQVKLTVDAVDDFGNFRNQARTAVSLIGPGPSNAKRTYDVPQTAPGRYAAELVAPEAGSYHLEIVQRVGDRNLFRQSRGFVIGYADELRLRPVNHAVLRDIADRSGGKYEPDPRDLLEVDQPASMAHLGLWPYLLGLSLCLFVMDVSIRRWNVARPRNANLN
jgi:uncharacterized membrane protein